MLRRTLTLAHRAILGALAQGPRSLGELEALAGRKKPTLLKHLGLLEEEGVVRKETVTTRTGRQARYRLQAHTLFLRLDPEAGAVLEFETAEAVDLQFLLAGQVHQADFRRDMTSYLRALARACEGWPHPPWVILFGSVARGEGTWKSDIDALVVLEPDAIPKGLRGRPSRAEASLRKAFAEAAQEAAHLLKPHFTTLEAFLGADSGVLRAAKEEGIVVWGDTAGGGEVWRQLRRYRTITS